MPRKHFHSFDAFRFSAFFLVFLHHIPKKGNAFIDYFLKSGGIGVMFFFVLSGFLITYILLYEKEHKKTISLKKFFARRILRIWPLFYLMIAFAYLSPYLLHYFNISYENNGYKPDLLTSILFAENYKMMLTNSFPDGAPLRVMWSLCIEEHFYILWGILFYLIPTKKVPVLILVSILIAIISRQIYTYLGISPIDVFSHLDYFAFGAIPAYILMYKQQFIHYVESIPRYVKYIFLLLVIAVVFSIPNIDVVLLEPLYPLILGALFSITILFTLGQNAIHINDNLWISKLGIYTYGLYLYHTIIILLFVRIFKPLLDSNWYAFVAISLLATIVVSAISYHLFEKQFLKLKRYFY